MNGLKLYSSSQKKTKWCQYLAVDCTELQCLASVYLDELGYSLSQIPFMRKYFYG